MDTLNKDAITLWSEIQNIIHKDNGCTAHYGLNKSGETTTIRVTTHNPKKQETFLLVEMQCIDEIDGLKRVLEWVKNFNISNEEFSHTVLWAKIGEGKTYMSYFYAKNARKALDKFFYDKVEDQYVIYEVKINPIA